MTVKTILRNAAYLGHMVQNKTGTVSCKVHKQISKPKEDWLSLIREYSQFEELDRPTFLQLVKPIEVGEKYKVDGETHRDVKIYYNIAGHVEL